jgi:hypothetical protein
VNRQSDPVNGRFRGFGTGQRTEVADSGGVNEDVQRLGGKYECREGEPGDPAKG